MSSRRAPYDLVILGSGSAAFAAAIRASELGRKAVMVERGTIGGTCVNVGCVPSKQLLATGETYRTAQENDFEALHCQGESLDFSRAIAQKDALVRGLRRSRYIDVVEELGEVDLIKGEAAFTSPHEVKVDGQRIGGRNFLMATGSHPWVPPTPGLERVGYMTNVEGLSPGARPESLLVVGGRALGLGFALYHLLVRRDGSKRSHVRAGILSLMVRWSSPPSLCSSCQGDNALR